MRISTVVTMRGGCRDAIKFYQDVFGAELRDKITFGEASELKPLMREELKECIYHAELLIGHGGKELSIVFADSPAILFASSLATATSGQEQVIAAAAPQTGTQDNIQFEIEDEDGEWLREIFGKLSTGGGKLNYDLQAKEPYRLFGSLIDRFGICWTMIQR